ncbi:glycosyltransferase family 2 protein [Marinibactrum halimedae]|uniref:Glycosyl transferase family 2 n=1 Tax=Marinibactrum halimedae TaxID=1444977 RepID=A0AA37T349_9GAMM|nr:glycosyltransferase family 2 protein [Marinibactrum halimedae]MCD9459762.1 glycosyltransferase [Marinibactrum halimedae]GLS24481.1 glycosyl transferase family 2 [Marinibactrum halimedae]
MSERSYVIISPCRDEEEFMKQTLDTVVGQSELPALWVIVDDGSTDASPQIMDEYAAKYDFIQIVRRENRGFRSVGPGVVDTFYAGFKAIEPDKYQYICKLDLDLELPERYFETLMNKMEENPRIGTCSGKPYNRINGKYISERRGDEMSVGMTKFYRMSCFKQIGGLVREVMWDAIDSHRCRQLGWIACSWDEPELRFTHLRIMGSSQHGVITGRMRHGFGQFYMGTGPLYMLASSIFRMLETPYVIGGAAMYWGYIKSFFNGSQRMEDKELRKFIRRYQWQCLLQGKKSTTKKWDAKLRTHWDLKRLPLPMPVDQ